jgi:hypothetical protein
MDVDDIRAEPLAELFQRKRCAVAARRLVRDERASDLARFIPQMSVNPGITCGAEAGVFVDVAQPADRAAVAAAAARLEIGRSHRLEVDPVLDEALERRPPIQKQLAGILLDDASELEGLARGDISLVRFAFAGRLTRWPALACHLLPRYPQYLKTSISFTAFSIFFAPIFRLERVARRNWGL